MYRDIDIRRITARQHGLIRRSQLTELGIPSGSLAHAIRTGRLEWLSERVLRLGGSARTLDQLAMAAALDIPGGAVAILSAGAMMDLPGFELEPIHVLTDRTPNRGGPHLGIVHTSVRYTSGDVMVIRGIPVTNPLRTLRDLAGRLHFDRLDLVCERMLSRRLLRVEQLHRLMADLPLKGGARGTAALRRLALSRGPDHRPAESNLERRFEQILEDARDAPFERQVDLGDDTGWIGRADFVDRSIRLVVEVQSAMFHAGRVDRARDEARFARLRRAGWTVIEVNELDIWHHPDRVLAAVRVARLRCSKGGSPRQADRTT
jgi:very-short-patch-repair endonuclease